MKSMKEHGAGNKVYAWLKQLVPELRKRVPQHDKGGNFDKPAKKVVGELLLAHLEDLDLTLDSKKDFHIEGNPARWVDKKRLFMGSRCYPDLGLRLQNGNKRVAIEIDHGWTGAQIRTALTKGSFNVAVGDWQECYVLFFYERGDNRPRDQL